MPHRKRGEHNSERRFFSFFSVVFHLVSLFRWGIFVFEIYTLPANVECVYVAKPMLAAVFNIGQCQKTQQCPIELFYAQTWSLDWWRRGRGRGRGGPGTGRNRMQSDSLILTNSPLTWIGHKDSPTSVNSSTGAFINFEQLKIVNCKIKKDEQATTLYSPGCIARQL